jgi:hypothetical protein
MIIVMRNNKEIKNDFLDLGIDYLKHSESNFDIVENVPVEPSEKDKKKQQDELENEKIQAYNAKLEAILDVKYDLNKLNYESNLQTIIREDGNYVNSTIPTQIHKIYVRMINNNELMREIKDKKFQNYLAVRKNLELVLNKIIASKNYKLNYILPVINIHMNELDKYLLTYMVDLNFKANKESIIEYIKRKIRQKKEKKLR